MLINAIGIIHYAIGSQLKRDLCDSTANQTIIVILRSFRAIIGIALVSGTHPKARRHSLHILQLYIFLTTTQLKLVVLEGCSWSWRGIDAASECSCLRCLAILEVSSSLVKLSELFAAYLVDSLHADKVHLLFAECLQLHSSIQLR